uniref:SEFIR domain-containing protein n=1 Tax=Rhodnius prolixus TaxID=13249 RepID=T1HJS0_RHOPR
MFKENLVCLTSLTIFIVFFIECVANDSLINCGHKNSNHGIIMTFQAKYVFTSLYHLEIKPHVGKNAMQPCITDKMFIETNYVKQLIGNTELGIQYDYKSHSQELNFGINGGGNGLHLAEQGEDSGECCKRNYTKPGNYCVTVELEDPRCARPTLWAKSAKSCQWISDSTGALVPFKPPSVRLGEHKTLIWISTVGCISVILAVIICVYFKSYPKKIYHHYVSCAPLHTQQLSSINKPKILLLYPRDCEHFMNVMETFRSLLQEFLHAQVYDVWDIENWDTVNEAGYQWIFKYLTDKSIKVIVIASQCSKLFEIALINQKGIEYRGEPHCFDNLFLYSLKESLTLVSCSTDNYNRFFVVRLEEPGCEENRFGSITPCTVYTIPEHLKDLTLEIHNMDPGEVILNPEETSKILQFSKSLDELKQFKLNNPNYLNDLINLIDENR